MGRPELPVRQPSRPPGILALKLRDARRTAGISYAELASKTEFSRQTLQRAASGTTEPAAAVVSAYAQGCGADPAPLLVLWKRARTDKEQRSRGLRTAPAPHVRQIRDEADLGAALSRLHVQAGSPTCREIERRTAKGKGQVTVSKTTAQLFIARQRIPSSREQMHALLFAYNVAPHRHGLWLDAWSRVTRHNEAKRARSAHNREARRQPAQARRNKLEHVLATAAAAAGSRDPDTDAYLQGIHHGRRHRVRTTIVQQADPMQIFLPLPPLTAAAAPVSGTAGRIVRQGDCSNPHPAPPDHGPSPIRWIPFTPHTGILRNTTAPPSPRTEPPTTPPQARTPKRQKGA